jgi:hypothetical protein
MRMPYSSPQRLAEFFACPIPRQANVVEPPIVKFEQSVSLPPTLQRTVYRRRDSAEPRRGLSGREIRGRMKIRVR